MNRKPCVVLLANLIAALPLLANAQDPRIVQRQAAGAKVPRIEIVRVKRTDSAAPEFQFRLSDGVVDLVRGFSSTVSTASVMPGRRVSPKRSTRVMVAGELKALRRNLRDPWDDCRAQFKVDVGVSNVRKCYRVQLFVTKWGDNSIQGKQGIEFRNGRHQQEERTRRPTGSVGSSVSCFDGSRPTRCG